MVTRMRLGLAVAALFPGVVLACSDIWGFRDVTLIDAGADAPHDAPPATDAGGDVVEARAPDAMPEAAPGCAQALPPGRPNTDDTPDGGDGGVDIVFAATTLDIGQNSSSAFDPNHPLGFDLDGVCTCFEDAGGSCVGTTQVCDTAGGRDESANVVLAEIAVDPYLSQAGLQASLSEGDFGLLLHVHGYNGLANDQSVIVEYFPSGGTLGASPDAGAAWTVTSGSVFNMTGGVWVSNYLDGTAYVKDFVLVSQLDSFPLLVIPKLGNGNPITFDLSSLVVAAPLVQTGGSWSIQGAQVGARWVTSDALYDMHTIQDLSGQSLCGSDSTYMTLVSHICDGADIAASPNLFDAGAPCSALSVGLGFDAVPASMGGKYDPPVVGIDCPDGWAPSCP